MIIGSSLTLAVTALAAVCGVVGLLVFGILRASRRDAQILTLLATFGPVGERTRSDPRVLLDWYPIAALARLRFPEAFAEIDQDGIDQFPFGVTQLEAAHTRWTADWLAWERNHAAEYRQKAKAIEAELSQSTGTASHTARMRLDTLERDKLEQYQRRYEEYVRVSRALKELSGTTGETNAGLGGAD